MRLEDCTGSLLGYLPQDEDDETESEWQSELSETVTEVGGADAHTVDLIARVRALTARCRELTDALHLAPYQMHVV